MKPDKNEQFSNLPLAAADYIRLVIKKMGYRRKIRQDVQRELIAHFEDALESCKDEKQKEEAAQKLIAEFGDAKLLGVVTRRAKKRCRPIWRTCFARFFQTVGILFLCLILYCIYLSIGKPNIAVNYVERANELARPKADDSLNAAPLYQKAFDLYVPEPNIGNKKLLDLIWTKQEISELTPEELAALKQWIADNNDALEIFKQASLKPYCWWNRQAKNNFMLNVLIPDLPKIRNVARLLSCQTKIEISQDRIDEAFNNILACYRAGMHYTGPKTTIEQLVGVAIEAIACKTAAILLEQPIDAQKLQHFQNELEKLTASDHFTVSFEGEKLLFYDIIQRTFTDDGCGSGHLIPGRFSFWNEPVTVFDANEWTLKHYTKSIIIALMSADRRATREKFDNAFEIASRWTSITPYQKHNEHLDAQRELGKLPITTMQRMRTPFYFTFMPAYERVIELSFRNKIQCESMPVIMAVLRYKQDKSDYPEKLEQLLEAGYLKQIPMDPYSDKPIVYKKTDNNFTLYSVGINFIDDGGKTFYTNKGSKPVMWGDPNKPSDAVFWPVPKNKPVR